MAVISRHIMDLHRRGRLCHAKKNGRSFVLVAIKGGHALWEVETPVRAPGLPVGGAPEARPSPLNGVLERRMRRDLRRLGLVDPGDELAPLEDHP